MLVDTVFYIFDYQTMDSEYGLQAFSYINTALTNSLGNYAFCHGDIEVVSGGPSSTPKFLRKIASQGSIATSPTNETLGKLEHISHIYGYAVVLWTEASGQMESIHKHLGNSCTSYLGSITLNKAMGSSATYYSEMNRLLFPQAVIFKNGNILQNSNYIGNFKNYEPQNAPTIENEQNSAIVEEEIAVDKESSSLSDYSKLVKELGKGIELAKKIAEDEIDMPTYDQLSAIADNKNYLMNFLRYFKQGNPNHLEKNLLRKLRNTPDAFKKQVAILIKKEGGDEIHEKSDRSFFPYGVLILGFLLLLIIIYIAKLGKTPGWFFWLFMSVLSFLCFLGGSMQLLTRPRRRWLRGELPYFQTDEPEPLAESEAKDVVKVEISSNTAVEKLKTSKSNNEPIDDATWSPSRKNKRWKCVKCERENSLKRVVCAKCGTSQQAKYIGISGIVRDFLYAAGGSAGYMAFNEITAKEVSVELIIVALVISVISILIATRIGGGFLKYGIVNNDAAISKSSEE
jgi:hypothetical protein